MINYKDMTVVEMVMYMVQVLQQTGAGYTSCSCKTKDGITVTISATKETKEESEEE